MLLLSAIEENQTFNSVRLTFRVTSDPYLSHTDFDEAIKQLSIKMNAPEYSKRELYQLSSFLILLEDDEDVNNGNNSKQPNL